MLVTVFDFILNLFYLCVVLLLDLIKRIRHLLEGIELKKRKMENFAFRVICSMIPIIFNMANVSKLLLCKPSCTDILLSLNGGQHYTARVTGTTCVECAKITKSVNLK